MSHCCEHVIRERGHKPARQCNQRATFHYRSTSGFVIDLCGKHANTKAHHWKNPKPISESV